MAPRKFELPGIHDLTKDQERARALPKAGCHLIIGGPGTGKSVIALMRARRYHEDNDYMFLVFNRMLHGASLQLIGNQLIGNTWQRWFHKLYRAVFGEDIPKTGIDGEFRPIDWESVLNRIAGADQIPPPERPFLIIDEGQDMPPKFYHALVNLGFENFFVVADQNQQITQDNCSRRDLENILDIDPNEVIELKENFRNPYPVARLAREFYTGDPASPPPQLPKAKPSVETPLLVEYGQNCELDFPGVVTRILKRADLDPRKLIGVITPNNILRERYLKALRETETSLDNGSPRIETYAAGQNVDVAFDEGGIVVINAQSCKGLEFDTVFLADIHEHFCNHRDLDTAKKRFYVMAARAKERVILLKEAGKHCPVDAILPKEKTILCRWR
jgi:DNA helicase II / ATP-dependent DNA helicase PcrA